MVLALCAPLSFFTTENSASLGPACGFPALHEQVVALLLTTTDAPSSDLIFRRFRHSVVSSLTPAHSDSDDPRLDIIQILSM